MRTCSYFGRPIDCSPLGGGVAALLLCVSLMGCRQTGKSASAPASIDEKLKPAAIDVGLLGAPSGTPNAKAAVSSTAKSSLPKRGVVWYAGDEVKIGYKAGKGLGAMLEVYGFDEKKRTSGEVGGMVMTLQESPVPVVMYSMNMGTFGGSMCASYANIILDFSSLKEPMKSFGLGIEQSTEGSTLGEIDLAVGSTKELLISPENVVFPEQARTVQADGPFAQFVFTAGKVGKIRSIPADSVLVITRNATEVSRSSFPGAGDYVIGLKRVKNTNDIVSWRVEDKSGRISYRSTLGIPVSGAIPNLVEYTIPVTSHPLPSGK